MVHSLISFSRRRRLLGTRTAISRRSSSSRRTDEARILMVISIITLLILAVLRPNEGLQLMQQYSSMDNLQQSNPLKAFSSLVSTSSSASEAMSSINENKMNLLLYITTHFSEQHLRYFHCCWPKLVQESPLISSAHILVVASNHTPVDPKVLDYLSSDLFQKNPSYQIQFLSNYQNPCTKFRNEVPKGMSNNNVNALKVPVNYKQCMANFGVRAGFEHGWVFDKVSNPAPTSTLVDWMIRINPDVLIRKSKWLLQTMQESVDVMPTTSLSPTMTTNATITMAIGVHCNTRQLHTDFFALRPHYWNRTAFSKMGRFGNKWNHERTAYKDIVKHMSAKKQIVHLPDVDPSEGSCRVRGENASVYHVHDSCKEDDMACHALDGWDLSQ